MFYPNFHNYHPTRHTLSIMSSTADAVAAKLAERANVRKQLEHCKQLEEEAEQERLTKELEEMKAEEE